MTASRNVRRWIAPGVVAIAASGMMPWPAAAGPVGAPTAMASTANTNAEPVTPASSLATGVDATNPNSAIRSPQPIRPDQTRPLSSRASSKSRNADPVAEATNAPTRPASTTRGVGSALSTILPLAAVIALIFGCSAVVRRVMRRTGGLMAQLGAGGRAPSGVLEVLGRYPVSRGMTLVILKLDRRVLLVTQSAGRGIAGSGAGMQTLTEITDADEVASIVAKTRDQSGDSLARKFQAALSREDAHAAHSLGSLENSASTDVTTRPAAVREGTRALRAKLAAARSAPLEGGAA